MQNLILELFSKFSQKSTWKTHWSFNPCEILKKV